MTRATLPLRVTGRRMLTPDICEFELGPVEGEQLPHARAGAHIEVLTPAGTTNSYSLTGRITERARYRIAVDRQDSGAGGSRSLVDTVDVGDEILASPPLNTFALVEGDSFLLIAAGIGITPIFAMAHELVQKGAREIELIYLTRSVDDAAYLDEILSLAPSVNVTVHHRELSARRMDLWGAVAEPRGRQLFCCGPERLQEDVRALTMHWRPSHVHFERFTAAADLDRAGLPFEVIWGPDDRTVRVGETQSMLTALRESGLELDSSCESGTCGTCILRLVSGRPDHRDAVLSPQDQRDFVMPCVSRSLDERLTVAPLADSPLADAPLSSAPLADA